MPLQFFYLSLLHLARLRFFATPYCKESRQNIYNVTTSPHDTLDATACPWPKVLPHQGQDKSQKHGSRLDSPGKPQYPRYPPDDLVFHWDLASPFPLPHPSSPRGQKPFLRGKTRAQYCCRGYGGGRVPQQDFGLGGLRRLGGG